jgi:hypothetical protein
MVSISLTYLHEWITLFFLACCRGLFVITISIVLALPVSAVFAAEPTIKIGVLENGGTDQCLAQWSPRAEYLTEVLPGNQFEIVPIAFDQIIQVVEQGSVDFILVNSALYVELEVNHCVDRIATLKNKLLSGTYITFGEAIFVRKIETIYRLLVT